MSNLGNISIYCGSQKCNSIQVCATWHQDRFTAWPT